MTNPIIYKIRNKKTGLFSKGGSDCLQSDYGWSKSGKSWTGMGPLKNHLAQYVGSIGYSGYNKDRFSVNLARIIDEWEIVSFVMQPENVIPMNEIYNDFVLIKKVSR